MEKEKIKVYGEFLLVLAVITNSLGVVLMLYSGAGISAISSVSHALSLVLPFFTQGTWTYIVQGLLVGALFVLRKKITFGYLFSFVVGFFFGLAIDLHKKWVYLLPATLPCRVVWYVCGFLLVAFGVALMNKCRLPIIPTDLFPREVSRLKNISYTKVKTVMDVTSLLITLLLILLFIHRFESIGVGTVFSALTLGKAISLFGKWFEKRFTVINAIRIPE